MRTLFGIWHGRYSALTATMAQIVNSCVVQFSFGSNTNSGWGVNESTGSGVLQSCLAHIAQQPILNHGAGRRKRRTQRSVGVTRRSRRRARGRIDRRAGSRRTTRRSRPGPWKANLVSPVQQSSHTMHAGMQCSHLARYRYVTNLNWSVVS